MASPLKKGWSVSQGDPKSLFPSQRSRRAVSSLHGYGKEQPLVIFDSPLISVWFGTIVQPTSDGGKTSRVGSGGSGASSEQELNCADSPARLEQDSFAWCDVHRKNPTRPENHYMFYYFDYRKNNRRRDSKLCVK